MKIKVLNKSKRMTEFLKWSCLLGTLFVGLISWETTRCQTPATKLVRIVGIVTDAHTHERIPGISVYVKNQLQRGTATGIDGKYTLMIEPTTQSIVFSGIGYQQQEIKYTGQTEINVELKESVNELEEVKVVSIGYGQQKREKVAGSIVSITAEELNDMPAPNFATLLQGKLPGLAVNNWSGEPGVRNEVYIRGVGVVGNNRSSAPLYVIDGIPLEQTQDLTILKNGTNTDPLASINPNDIESIDVLKDAAATAIYGARGANGVILVKTKQGKKNRPVLSYRMDVSINAIPPLQNTVGGNLERRLKIPIWSLMENQDLPLSITDSLNPFWNNSTNWQKLYYRNTISHNHDLGISGGTSNLTYRVSLGYTKDKGIMIGSDFKRYTLSSNTKYEPINNLSLAFNIRLSRTDRSRPNGQNNALQQNVGIGTNYPSSLIPSTNSDKMQKQQDAFKLMEDKNIDDEIAPAIVIGVDFLKSFHLNSTFSMDYRISNRETFKPSALNGTQSNGLPNGPSFNMSKSTSTTYSMDHVLSYVKTLKGDHTIDALFGFSQGMNENSNLYVNATKGSSDAIHDLNGYTQENTTSNSRYVAYGSQSFFARLQYDYKSRYIVSATWRMDGSSRFGKNYRYAQFPSIALAYNLHKEKFMEEINWIDQLKLRWTWGITGTEAGISEYLSQGIYKAPTISYNSAINSSTYNGKVIFMPDYNGGIANPDLTWEEAEQYNFGTDISLFKYRVNIGFDVFWKESRNILFNSDLPDISGYQKVFKNATKLVNHGYEFNISGQLFDPQVSKFTWQMTLLGSITKNYVTELPNNNSDYLQSNYLSSEPNLLRVGRPANGFFVYKCDGVYATDDDVPVNPYTGQPLLQGNVFFQAGDYIIRDMDNNGKIYEVSSASGGYISTDRIFAGSPFPKMTGGWNNSLRYKNWTLNANFVYSLGRKVMNMTTAEKIVQILQNPESNMYDYTENNHWQKPGDKADWAVLDPQRYTDFRSMYTVKMDKYIERASFLRLNNLRIAYDFNRDWLKKCKIRRLYVYASATNLWTWTNYSGADPENVNMYGVDQGKSYARPKRFNIGLNVEF